MLVIAMIFCLAVPAMAANTSFSDMPEDYSKAALEAAVANGLLTGADGKIMPNDSLTRAQMAAVINRAFGANEQASLVGFSDVASTAWYYADMAKAVQMKTFNGSGSSLNPDAAITRQEAFTVLARALNLEAGIAAELAAFADSGSVAAWAVGSTAAMIKSGYVHGADGKINPTASISRKDFAVLMNNIIKHYITASGTVTTLGAGSVMINTPNVTLKGVTVQGDLIIGDGVGSGDVTLDSVKVTGKTIVRGGGVNSFVIKGDSELGSIVVSKVNGNVRVSVEGGAKVDVVYIADGKDDVVVEGKVAKLEVNAETPVVVQKAEIA